MDVGRTACFFDRSCVLHAHGQWLLHHDVNASLRAGFDHGLVVERIPELDEIFSRLAQSLANGVEAEQFLTKIRTSVQILA